MLHRRRFAASAVLCLCLACPALLVAQNLELRQTLQNPTGNPGFGYSIAGHGDTVAIAAPLIAPNGIQRGAVAIYVRQGSSWALQQVLTRPDGVGFGGTLAVHGDTLIAGRANFSVGSTAAYVYVRTGTTWSLQGELTPSGSAGSYPAQVDVDGDSAVIAYPSGGVYAFGRTGTTWSEQARLRDENPPGQQGFTGRIDLSGDTVAIGNPTEAIGAFTNHGAVYVFVRIGATWAPQARLVPPANRSNAFIGTVVALSGTTLIAGPGGGGAVYERVGATWLPQPSLPVPPKPNPVVPEYGLRNVVLDLDTAVASFNQGSGSPSVSWVYKRVGASWVRLDPSTVVLGTVALVGNALLSGFPYYPTNDLYSPGPGIAYLYAVADTSAPDAVTLTGEVNANTVSLSWTPAPTGTAASSYVIEAGTAPGASDYFNGNIGSLRALSSPPLPNGRYYIRVRPVNAFGVGPASNEVALTVGPPPVPVPGPPTLDGSVDGALIALTWSPSASGGAPASYWLEAGTTAGAVDLFSGSLGAATAISATVTPGTYHIRVRGVNADGAGPASSERVFTVAGCAFPPVPGGLRYTRDGNVVTVRWDAAPGAAEYFLRVGTSRGAANVYDGTNGPFTSISAPAPPGTYYLQVQAVNACGASAPTADLEIQVP
jgi:hypothetical protein